MIPTKPPISQYELTPAIPRVVALPFIQELKLVKDGRLIAMARWHAPEGSDGIVQLLDLHVDPDHQRQGHGSALLREVYKQATMLFNRLEIKPRRIWASVEQKRQVNARAFFSRHGFHHVTATKNLHRKQEALIYVRSFD
jgi:ribosomal protein S18 acetylase RimI-like enzyme